MTRFEEMAREALYGHAAFTGGTLQAIESALARAHAEGKAEGLKAAARLCREGERLGWRGHREFARVLADDILSLIPKEDT